MIVDDLYNNREARIYNDASPTLRSERTGLKCIVAMRGRNMENPNSRQTGLPTEQRLEPNLKGISNTLTSVQKDNLVLECSDMKPVCLNSKGGRGGVDGLQPSLQDRVYSTKAISPAVTTSFMPNFLEEERNAKDCGYNNKEIEGICTKGKTIDIASTILAGYERTNMTGFNADNGVLEYVNIKQATKDGYIRCRVGGDSRPFLPGQQDEEGESTDGG